MKLGKLTTVAAIATLGTALSACAADTETTTTESGVNLVQEGTLTVCTHLPYKPFQFTQGDEIVGFDVDIANLAAETIEDGVELRVVDVPWETITTGEALNTGKCDLAQGGMTITDERAAVMDFTDPYFEATQALLTKTGSGYADLESLAGKKIGVQEGTTGEIYVNENAPEDAKIVSFEDLALLQAAVKTGQVEAGVNDNGVLYDYAKENPDTEVTAEFDTGEQYGMSVKKDGNDELLNVFNEALEKAESDGTYEEIYKKWFGETPSM
ncbi:ABC transporter substrate-binding protein [Nocardioides gansuensis]|uniref:ABC transporter substrate-binding protein n=1 Tax=Nocardioides gansuensis TaxID=2138300 RepID=A0A2T8F621_9ACTN|nr:ABC transporter substrate-binding protein [Nocardioides gansuensis]PVG81154.1 ABC transporter substrate-binding protein [Nocardioides gansuensis]